MGPAIEVKNVWFSYEKTPVLEGVSLTLVEVEDTRFSVALIPHTLNVTTLGKRQPGDRVNLETDVLAKYVERQLAWKGNNS